MLEEDGGIDEFICDYCKELLREPRQASCGHRFCLNCLNGIIENHIKNQSALKCPECVNEKVEATIKKDHMPDYAIKKFMNRRKVVCINADCSWQGFFKDYAEHEKVCSTTSVVSSNEGHLSSDGDIPEDVCMEDLWKKIEDLRMKIEVYNRKATTYEGIGYVLNSSVSHLLTQMTEIDDARKVDYQSREEEKRKHDEDKKRISKLEYALSQKDIIIDDLKRRLGMLESASYNGELIWKITSVAKKRDDAMRANKSGAQSQYILSPCFFTSRTGYKMCIRMYMDGEGAGKGTHLSLFFVIMRGNYDDLLPWPFNQKVAWMVLDQGNYLNGQHARDAFRPDTKSVSFQKPVGVMNTGAGQPQFLPLQNLQKYIKNDTLYLKIVVDTNGLLP